MNTALAGQCDERFAAVRREFARNFDERGDIGAAVAVHVDGRPVIDLWGGLADPATGHPWDRDTMALVFSTTKGLTAVCALLLWERGQLDLDAPVAEAWPDFAAAGKVEVTTRQLLSHQAGLPAFDEPITVEECHDPDLVAARLAAQAPRWEPGTAHGYHAITYGWLVGEVVRRVSGSSVGELLAREVSGPLGLDTYLGLPPALEDRVAVLQPMSLEELPADALDDPRVKALMEAFLSGPSSLTFQVFTNPPMFDVSPFNSSALHQAEWPAASGITTARSLSRLYGELACDRVLAPATLDEAARPQVDGPDRVLLGRTRFGLGFALPSDLVDYGTPAGFGHDGAGGSVGFADRRNGIGFAYVMNRMGLGLGTDVRVSALVEALYSSLG